MTKNNIIINEIYTYSIFKYFAISLFGKKLKHFGVVKASVGAIDDVFGGGFGELGGEGVVALPTPGEGGVSYEFNNQKSYLERKQSC